MSGTVVEILRREGREFISATLFTDLSAADLTLLERSWGGARLGLFNKLEGAGVPRTKRPQSLHWDWRTKIDELKLLEATGFGVLCEDQWQAAMMTKTASSVSKLEQTKGMPLVYVDYVETAPWNWSIPALEQEGIFCGLGSLLLRQAVVQSVIEGFSGRVGLHSLPQAESFYERVGMVRLEADPKKQRLVYFEFTAEASSEFSSEGGGK